MREKTRNILDLFQQINQIPRCSKNEKQISNWLEHWGRTHQFSVKTDDIGNLVIVIPPTAGYEGGPVITFQGHMDMVCEKALDSDHDFSRDPIKNLVEGDWLRADKTTLGADNGIAIAMGMALAMDESVKHPPLELLFTVDEETGLTGAMELEPGFVEGKTLLNVDSEDEGVFTVGCAGGTTCNINFPLSYFPIPEGHQPFRLSAFGMQGGHSGVDIHKNRANAIKVLVRSLQAASLNTDMRIQFIRGGKAHNAIPREAEAILFCKPDDISKIYETVAEVDRALKNEYSVTDPNIMLTVKNMDANSTQEMAMSLQDTSRVINFLEALPHGVGEMSQDMEGLVETSSNLASIELEEAALNVVSSHRSFDKSKLEKITGRVEGMASNAGADVERINEYPAWQPDLASPLLSRCRETYRTLYKKDPRVEIMHAGLECAIIGAKYPDMDMISIGPTLINPHSPDEALNIPSVGKVWDFLAALLASYRPSPKNL